MQLALIYANFQFANQPVKKSGLSMNSNRTRIGTAVSIIWLIVMAYLALNNIDALKKMPPNEWGDFFAGAFAPLAFLWLVLGYLQQGDELRLSTNALRLQAEELKNSVEQQRALVEVSRLQVESEREALSFERRLREELSEPKFAVLGGGGIFQGNGHSTYNISISNTGHDATAFSAKFQLLGGAWQELMQYPLFKKGDVHRSSIYHHCPLEEGASFLLLQYTDGLGRNLEKTYRIARESSDPHAGLKFEPL